ncbi:MAG TPA: hypothetical protein PKV67_01895 [Hyphomonas sp.]|mgnify:CR=1 FL=1|uniref:Lipoprotein n=1 Tax=Hyphomonas polymorpha PS728 TaxID=1280954 RepID=A0A062VEV7_9PROT|nr:MULTISPECIES: hypothetical protein [Hyphomonas]KCZ97999.1 hypothetical protein HPO_11813 [Hyphomonas polymorpha PS728]MBA4226055.1 hypothetical protein [Hyphomonas sp.]HAY05056.1 hypothetical protein [Hyphomonas sp.]HRI99502.1 hypothetical protein [Hyphomonas sp.]HRK65918.1 hypothetical protein [Hyphomonas sp.]
MKLAYMFALLGTGFAPLAAQAQPASSPVGVWVGGDDIANCARGPLTLFMSDGVVAIFTSESGDLHSLGVWAMDGSTLTMTHNDLPLTASGESKPAISLEVVKLSDTVFTTRNSEGQERARVRCSDIEIGHGEAHGGH